MSIAVISPSLLLEHESQSSLGSKNHTKRPIEAEVRSSDHPILDISTYQTYVANVIQITKQPCHLYHLHSLQAQSPGPLDGQKPQLPSEPWMIIPPIVHRSNRLLIYPLVN